MIYLNLPDFNLGVRIYEFIVKFRKDYPEVFYEDTEIAAIFGNFSSAIWNGGGIDLSSNQDRAMVQDLIDFYNEELKIPLRFTFTNPLIEEKHCYDSYCNMIAECGHNGKNEILTSSNFLESYLRKNYPNYKYCHSIIASKNEPYDTQNKYYLSVMQRRMNNNWDFLETIPMEQRGRIEFLCTDPCPDDCPRLYTHYRDFARAQIEYDVNAPQIACSMDKVKSEFGFKYLKTLETYISREMIEKNYVPRGFNQFKLSGRGSISAIVYNLIEYFIKPEYRDDLRAMLYDLYL